MLVHSYHQLKHFLIGYVVLAFADVHFVFAYVLYFSVCTFMHSLKYSIHVKNEHELGVMLYGVYAHIHNHCHKDLTVIIRLQDILE